MITRRDFLKASRDAVALGCVASSFDALAQNESRPAGVQPKGILDDPDRPMIFLRHAEPHFREGLRQHGLLEGAGYRLHNTGSAKHRFGDQWAKSPLLAESRESGRLYYFDRICGGMPFQSLDGLAEIAASLKNDPNFLGFQVHEWGNSPIHDYERIHELILGKGDPFDAAHFVGFEGRIDRPFFSGGDFNTYRDIFRELNSLHDVESYLEQYFSKYVELASGQVLSVTGFGQLHHAALRLGAKNVMPEIGNQVPLTALQIAFARGAAREHGKPFGAYYEPWGGAPMGGYCALSFSPWAPGIPDLTQLSGFNLGPKFGSSRSLQRRLLYFSWLSGAAFYGEEWGAECCFSNWEDYPLTEYGAIVNEFAAINRDFPRPTPITPAALVMPPHTFGVDIRYVAGAADNVWRIAPPDVFHDQLRSFAERFYAPQPRIPGEDSRNLTPSPWIGCFDVLSADAPDAVLNGYPLLIYFDQTQATESGLPKERTLVFEDTPEIVGECMSRLRALLPYCVSGRVGCIQARSNGRHLVGVFNNLGISKTVEKGEDADPAATQDVAISGQCNGLEPICGNDTIVNSESNEVQLRIPAGRLAVLSFPDRA